MIADLPLLERGLGLCENLTKIGIVDTRGGSHQIEIDPESRINESIRQQLGLCEPARHLLRSRQDALVLNEIANLVQLPVPLSPWRSYFEMVSQAIQSQWNPSVALDYHAKMLDAETDCELANPVDRQHSQMQPELRLIPRLSTRLGAEDSQPA